MHAERTIPTARGLPLMKSIDSRHASGGATGLNARSFAADVRSEAKNACGLDYVRRRKASINKQK